MDGGSKRHEIEQQQAVGSESAPASTREDVYKRYSLSYFIRETFVSMYKPIPIEVLPSKVAYRKRPSGNMAKYLITGVIMLGIGLLVVYGNIWLTYFALTIGSFTIPLIFLYWFTQNDRYEPEPVTLIAYLFGWGAVAGILSLYVNQLVVPFLGVSGAALVEEPFKLFGVYLLAKSKIVSSEINSHLDGMIYGAAVGAGFASLENISYLLSAGGGIYVSQMMLSRSTTSFCHIAWTAIGARTLGLANALRGNIRITDMIPGLMISIPLHFTWNLFPETDLLRSFVIMPVTLLILIREVNMAVDDEVRWGFESVSPNEKRVRPNLTIGSLRIRRRR